MEKTFIRNHSKLVWFIPQQIATDPREKWGYEWLLIHIVSNIYMYNHSGIWQAVTCTIDFPFLFKVNCLTLLILLFVLTVLGLPGGFFWRGPSLFVPLLIPSSCSTIWHLGSGSDLSPSQMSHIFEMNHCFSCNWRMGRHECWTFCWMFTLNTYHSKKILWERTTVYCRLKGVVNVSGT